MKYGSECCRCGFCCAVEICRIGLDAIGQEQKPTPGPCPFMDVEPDGESYKATCQLYETALALLNEDVETCNSVFGIGAGCCIKATAYKGDDKFAFATLDPDIKRREAMRLLLRQHSETG